MIMDRKRLFSLLLLSVMWFGVVISPLISQVPLREGNSEENRLSAEPNTLDQQNINDQYSGSYQYISEYLDIAENLAAYIVSKNLTIGGGFAWNYTNVIRLGYSDGAAGIGDFFLDLFDLTNNSQYLDWADKVGIFLAYEETTNPQPWGKWPSFHLQTSAPNSTGLASGSAGIGKFLIRLWSATQNSTYKNLAQQIADRLALEAIATPNNGIKIKDQDSFISVPSTTLPNSTLNPIAPLFINGSLGGGNWQNDLNNPANILTLNPASYQILEANDYEAPTISVRLGVETDPTEGYFNELYQQIKLDTYPFYFNDTTLKLNVSVIGTIVNASLRVELYESDSQGYPQGDRIGSPSDPWNASMIGTEFSMISFNWSAGFPVLNGSSRYGYLIKTVIESNGETLDINNCFSVLLTTNSTYSKGILRTFKLPGTYHSYTNRDIVFELLSSPSSRVLNLRMDLNLTSWGLPANFNPVYLNQLMVNITITGASSTYLGYLQVYNYAFSYWETLPINAFGSSQEALYYNFPLATITNYVNTTNSSRPMMFRIIGMNPYSNFSYSLRQFNMTVGYEDNVYSLGYSTGAAGIGHFFLDMYEHTTNNSYLLTAQKLGNYIIYSANNTSTESYWIISGAERSDYDIGAAGIGDYLVRLAKYSSNDSSYIFMAARAGNRIVNNLIPIDLVDIYDESLGIGSYLQIGAVSSTGFMKGIGGVGQFLKDLGDRFRNTTILFIEQNNKYSEAARQIATFLCSSFKADTARTEPTVLLNVGSSYVFSKSYFNGSSYSLNYEEGSAGILSFLQEINSISSMTNEKFGSVISGALQWYIDNRLNEANNGSYYNLTDSVNSFYGISRGLAGIGKILAKISMNSIQGADQINSWLSAARSEDQNFYLPFSASNYGKGSLFSGAAGFGMGFINAYKYSKAYDDIRSATKVAKDLTGYSIWVYNSSSSDHYTGIKDGAAGIGLFFIELFKVTFNTSYLEEAESIAIWLRSVSESGNGIRFPLKEGDTIYYNTYFEGAAGIAYYYLQLFEISGNTTYRTWAINILNALSVKHVGGLWHIDDTNTGTDYRYTGYLYGSAGIADVFVYGYKLTGNSSYLNIARTTAEALNSIHTSYNRIFKNATAGGIIYSGLDYGYAGIIKFLINLARTERKNNSIFLSLADTLSLNLIGILKLQSGSYYTYRYHEGTSNHYIGYYSGVAGIAEAFLEAGLALRKEQYLIESYNCRDYAVFNANLATTRNENGTMSAIGILMNFPDFHKPTIQQYEPTSATNIQYDQEYVIRVTTTDLGSSLRKVIVSYYINDGLPNYVTANHTAGNIYEAAIPKINYNNNVSYTIIVEDLASWWRVINNNGQPFNYYVGDFKPPSVSDLRITGIERDSRNRIIEVLGGLTYGPNGGGYIRVKIQEDTLGAGLKYVHIKYLIVGLEGAIEKTENMSYAGSNEYYLKIDGKIDDQRFLKYGMSVLFTITAADNANNINNTYTAQIAPVIDRTLPKIERFVKIHPSSRIVDGTTIKLVVRATDFAEIIKDNDGNYVNNDFGGSGIKSVKLVWSNDRTLNVTKWNSKNLTKNDDLDWEVDFKVQGANKLVFYYYILEDNAGNIVAIDQNGDARDPDVVPALLHYFEVTTNWTLIMVIVGIIAGVVVVGYAIYVRTTSYVDRSVNAARMTAKWVGVKQWVAQKYNKIATFLLTLGARIERAIMNANIRKRIKRFVARNEDKWYVKLGKALWVTLVSFLKLMAWFIYAPFVAIWTAITKSGGKQIMVTALLGFALIVATVVKFFGEKTYPLRALFFIDLGFILFIGSFVIIILHLIYELAAK